MMMPNETTNEELDVEKKGAVRRCNLTNLPANAGLL